MVAVRDQAVVELLYGSGVRVGELCGLGPGDVDLPRRQLVVWGKGSKQRQLPMSDRGKDAEILAQISRIVNSLSVPAPNRGWR